MLALLEQLELDSTLLEDHRFADRVDMIDRLDELLMPDSPDGENNPERLHVRARSLLDALEDANARVCADIRNAVIRGEGAACLRAWFDKLGGAGAPSDSYDHADALVAGMFDFANVHDSGTAPGQDMVFYQPTPVRHVVAMIDKLASGPGDTLVDLGSGLGHVPMLVNILTGIRTIGIEVQAQLMERARETAQALNLHGVSFVHGDARAADLSAGTVFYLYTPFKGAVMDEALARLADEARDRPLRIVTFGPCTSRVGAEPWLESRDGPGENGVCVFHRR
ncbi:methyltransferase [Pinirhizobacter soli]|uniref:methyltransferase n=1 Tax=Pinirhizobacter soli TaxID=2786953 RepID=UPI002029C20A|nr:methyltransferase [Pinirhizobacter soli]